MSLFTILARDDCTNSAGGDTCEKPASNSKITAIVIGVITGVLLACLLVVIVIFQRRRTRRDNQEWTKDPQELEDYGMGTMDLDNTAKTGSVRLPPEAHRAERPVKAEGAGSEMPPQSRISVTSTVSLARQLRGHDDTLSSTAQVPRSLV
ncbi:hypothetical protein PFICI_15373 [Pestalotiopsis fici W106-1]|uniref:Uncharacterized protein n=1 Tax=Pestalotiopsis fici (strain W106-1 / CGMCC3.15140) TaxID=1229662 RepID=W3WJJ9_PESFW|nr:uncharacterized protein PFICI_15373 [Pestalotiopsis fici W106-1]ETS72981.1 hypothetical protein PFICI_15373 [Pestalotiopsis fici W106-1]